MAHIACGYTSVPSVIRSSGLVLGRAVLTITRARRNFNYLLRSSGSSRGVPPSPQPECSLAWGLGCVTIIAVRAAQIFIYIMRLSGIVASGSARDVVLCLHHLSSPQKKILGRRTRRSYYYMHMRSVL